MGFLGTGQGWKCDWETASWMVNGNMSYGWRKERRKFTSGAFLKGKWRKRG